MGLFVVFEGDLCSGMQLNVAGGCAMFELHIYKR